MWKNHNSANAAETWHSNFSNKLAVDNSDSQICQIKLYSRDQNWNC